MSRCKIVEKIYGDRVRRGCPRCPLFGIFISILIITTGCSLLIASLEGFLVPAYNLPGVLIVAFGIALTMVFLTITCVGERRYVRVLIREIDTIDNAPVPRVEEKITAPNVNSDILETLSTYPSVTSESSNSAQNLQEPVNEVQDSSSPNDTNSSVSFMILQENGTASGHNIDIYGEQGHGALHDNEAGMIPVQHNIPLDIEAMEPVIPLDIGAADLEQPVPGNQVEAAPEHEVPLNKNADNISDEETDVLLRQKNTPSR